MEILQGSNIYVYMFIFFGKMLEVSIATVRVVLINRGERKKGSLIALLEIILWVTVTGTVLADFTSDFIKVVVFCLAFAMGNYLGSWIENKLALGLSTLQIITNENENINDILESLRNNHIAVTVMNGEGKEGLKKILLIYLKRNKVISTIKLINSINNNCVITVSDVKVLRGGFIKK